MSSKTMSTIIAMASVALAFPSSSLERRQGGCPATQANGDGVVGCYSVNIGYYTDDTCTQLATSYCAYGPEQPDACTVNKGDYGCLGANGLPDKYWAKVIDTPYPDVQVLFTEDQSCPPSGPGAVFASLVDNQSCVMINIPNNVPGISVFPAGGAAVARRDANVTEPVKRDNTKCSGFNVKSQQSSESKSVQVSTIVDCTNGNDSGCTITMGSEHTESVTTSYSATAGGGIEGIFEASVTFGMDYTDSSTTSLQEGFSVAAGQKGYLSAYSAATLFSGTYTGCDQGDAEQDGQVLAIKTNGFTYVVVNTGA